MYYIKSSLRPYIRALKSQRKSLVRESLRPLRSLPLKSEFIGPPKGFYSCSKDWATKSDDRSLVEKCAHYQTIHPEHLISRTIIPKTIEASIHPSFNPEYQRWSPETFVLTIPNGRVWNRPKTSAMAVITPDDHILADLSEEFGNKADQHLIFNQIKLPPVRQVEGNVAVLSAPGGGEYYHSIFDVAPRIFLLQQCADLWKKIDYFVVNSYQKKFQKELFSFWNINPQKVIDQTLYPHIRGGTLIVPSMPGIPGNVPSWSGQFVREGWLNQAPISDDSKKRRIFISRSNARYRRMTNEDSVMKILGQYGFERVILEEMSLAEKATLFASTEAVVAPHGAGLTHIMCCQPQTKIIELFSPNYVNVCNWALSNLFKLDYYYLTGEGLKSIQSRSSQVVDNITINLSCLSKTLDLANLA